jgi:hypothetical protein
MPLFHIHGLVAALLASLRTGASVACAPGFHQLHFFEWVEELAPTWYTAVPTMHAAVLARTAEHAETVGRHRLRFIRSSSAALPVPVLDGLEASVRGAGGRGLRHDRGARTRWRPTRCRRTAASRHRRAGSWARDRRPRPGRPRSLTGGDRRGGRPRLERLRGLRGEP